MRFDLTDMRLFLTVIEHGSITAGAQAMHLALASASECIAGMEAALGAPLLERNRRGVQATPAGEAFYAMRARSSGRSSKCAASCAPTQPASKTVSS